MTQTDRRRRGKRAIPIIGTAVLLFAVVLVLPFFLVRIPGVRVWLLDQTVHRSLLQEDWRLSIESVDRFDPWGVRMEGLSLSRRSSGEGWGSVRRIDLRWNPRNLMRRRMWADWVELDSIVVRIDREGPSFKSRAANVASRTNGASDLPWIRCKSLRLGVELRDGQGDLASGELWVENLEHHQGHLGGDLRSVAAQLHRDTLDVAVGNGQIVGSVRSGIDLTQSRLTVEGLDGVLDLALRFPEGEEAEPRATVALVVDRLEPNQIGLVRRLGLSLDPSDSLSGEARIEVDRGSVSARLDLSGRLLEGPLESLHLLATARGDSVHLVGFELHHRLGSVLIEGDLDRKAWEGSGRVRLEHVNLADRSLNRWLASMPATDLSGQVYLNGKMGQDQPRLSANGRLTRADLVGIHVGPLLFSGRYEEGLIEADRIVFGTEQTGWSLRGTCHPTNGDLDLTAQFHEARLEDWLEPILGLPVAGRMRGTVAIQGSIEHPEASGHLTSSDFRVEGVTADSLWLERFEGSIQPMALRGSLGARGLDLYGVRADSALLQVDWQDRLRVEGRVMFDSIAVATEAVIVPADPGSVLVTRLEIRPGRLPMWQSQGQPRVVWSAAGTRIDGIQLASSEAELSGRLAIGSDQSLDATLEVDHLDLGKVSHLLALPDSALLGTADLRLRAGGHTEQPSFTGELAVRDLVVARWPVDQLQARLAIDPNGTLSIDSLQAGGVPGAGRLIAPRIVARTHQPLPAIVSRIGSSLDSLLLGTELAGSCRLRDLSMSRVLRAAMVAGPEGGSGLFAQPIDPMMARIHTVRAGKLGALAAIVERVGGRAEADLEIGGTAGTPVATLTGRIHRLHLYQAWADSVDFCVSILPEMAVLDSLRWHRDGNISRARGRLPITLSMLPKASRLHLDRPLGFEAELPDIDLGILRVVSRDIADPQGFLSGAVALRGTPNHSWLEGSLAIRDGGMRIPKREERLHSIQGTVHLDSSGVTIDSMEGRIGSDGRLSLRGTFRNLEEFDLEGEVTKATAYETGLYHFTVDGDFRAFPAEEHGKPYPLIVGTVDILEGAIVGDLAKAPATPERAGKEASPWRAEIDVFAPGNIRMQTTVASVELGETENLHVSFDDPEINVSGGIEVLGGRYRVFNNIFTITSGRVEFRDTGRGVVAPILDVYAQTQVSLTTDLNEVETVTIHATGPITELKLDFDSSSGLTPDEIVALLSIGRLRDESGSIGVADPSRQYLFTEVVSQIESEITQLISPLQNVSVRPGGEPGSAWQLNVRQTLLPQVSLAYTRDLTSGADQEVSVHYNLRGRLYLNAAVERRQEEGAYADRYSLDLKMRFEYK